MTLQSRYRHIKYIFPRYNTSRDSNLSDKNGNILRCFNSAKHFDKDCNYLHENNKVLEISITLFNAEPWMSSVNKGVALNEHIRQHLY